MKNICETCGIEVVFNLHIFEATGMCGTCTTGEARLNYEEDVEDNDATQEALDDLQRDHFTHNHD